MSQPESRLQRRIRRALEAAFPHSYWWKTWGGPYQPAGMPDLAGIVVGRSIFVEVKRPVGRVSPVQRMMHTRLRRAGAIVVVAKTPDEAIAMVVMSILNRSARLLERAQRRR